MLCTASEDNVDIRHTEVCIDDQHPLSEHAQGQRKVHGQVRLSDAALAARDRYHFRSVCPHGWSSWFLHPAAYELAEP